jgi:uncharacterized protein with NAD-binding domain and iron-sulfur cluster
VVLAVPHHALPAVAPALPLVRLGSSAIVNVHVIYDRRVTDLPFGAAVGTTTQWFFDRTHSSGLAGHEPEWQYLAVTISAADALLDVPSPVLQTRIVDELARLLPAAGHAEVVESFVTRERRATFRQEAGSNAARPGPVTDLPGVYLAGAWTATGWPDTMESAVRSGHAAADAVLRDAAPSRRAAARQHEGAPA